MFTHSSPNLHAPSWTYVQSARHHRAKEFCDEDLGPVPGDDPPTFVSLFMWGKKIVPLAIATPSLFPHCIAILVCWALPALYTLHGRDRGSAVFAVCHRRLES